MKSIVKIIVLVASGILGAGAAIALYSRTLVVWWLPWVFSLFVALLVSNGLWGIWRSVTGASGKFPNYVCSVLYVTVLLTGLFFTLNYAFPDRETVHAEQVRVERKYSKTRHQSRRVGRNRYVPGKAYKVYFMEVEFEDGRKKELEIPLARYNRVHSGQFTSLELARGLFGFPVIRY